MQQQENHIKKALKEYVSTIYSFPSNLSKLTISASKTGLKSLKFYQLRISIKEWRKVLCFFEFAKGIFVASSNEVFQKCSK